MLLMWTSCLCRYLPLRRQRIPAEAAAEHEMQDRKKQSCSDCLDNLTHEAFPESLPPLSNIPYIILLTPLSRPLCVPLINSLAEFGGWGLRYRIAGGPQNVELFFSGGGGVYTVLVGIGNPKAKYWQLFKPLILGSIIYSA